MRKPIQISGNMVLCDDGAIFELRKERMVGPPMTGDTVSYYIGEVKDRWILLPNIPQNIVTEEDWK